ncbi:MAG: ATP-binding protein [Methanosphaera stadtmanae]|jgi:anti-sigma regulatory factor (Ser/Thr protein kinase)|nr:ATP-binding protein [Methanosphaera stadtmanae]
MKSINLEPKVEELIRLNKFIEDELSVNQYAVKLIVEELFVNIVNYSECNYIKVFFELNNTELKMIFVDDGVEFNPLLKEDPEFPEDVADAKIGGLGIHLVKNMADEIFYEYIDGENHLTIITSVEK